MSSLLIRAATAAAIVSCLGVALAACSSAPAAPDSAPVEEVQPAAEPLAEPSIEITYELDGEFTTAQVPVAIPRCGTVPFYTLASVGYDGILSEEVEDGVAGIYANVWDGYYIGFRGEGTLEFEEVSALAQRATVDELRGVAILVEVPEGSEPLGGGSDWAGGTEVPATLSATLECSLD